MCFEVVMMCCVRCYCERSVVFAFAVYNNLCTLGLGKINNSACWNNVLSSLSFALLSLSRQRVFDSFAERDHFISFFGEVKRSMINYSQVSFRVRHVDSRTISQLRHSSLLGIYVDFN